MPWKCQSCGGPGRVGQRWCVDCDPDNSAVKNRIRDEAGVIVTAREIQTGELHTLHEDGLTIEALALACERIEKLGPQWRVVTVSTPRMIARDLQGQRVGGGTVREGTKLDDPRMGEKTLLGKAGYRHLLEERPIAFARWV